MELFPFDRIREGQKEFMEDVLMCVSSGKGLIANAPAGIGKTAGTLAPCLSYALENGKTVLFMTPKHSQHRMAIETVRNINRKFNAGICAIDIIGKKWLCPVPSIEMLSTQDFNDYCNSVKRDEKCVFYNSTRNKDGLGQKAGETIEKILHSEPMHAEELKDLCKSMCPYEISLEAAKRSNLIICDYFHIFSTIRSSFLRRINKDMEDLIIIVDEAHNLPDRIRKILSGKISSISLRYAEKEARAFGFHDTAEDIFQIEKILRSMARKTGDKNEIFISKAEFLDDLGIIKPSDEMLEEFKSAAIEIREGRKKSFIGSLARFIELWDGEDVGYARILKKYKKSGRSISSLNYVCLDPMIMTKDVIQDAHSVIMMSGTLSPGSMYRNLLGFGEDSIIGSYKSGFPESNRLNLIIPDVTTQYTERTEDNMNRIADYILRICSSSRGNMAAFFPSYYFRDQLFPAIKEQSGRIIFMEKPDSTKADKAKLFEGFMNCKNSLLMGVQAGSFAEGVDYFGGVLKCVMVVGISLSHPDLETQALINYYDHKFRRGWDYGYSYPAINRAIQSAGRCIRNENDRAAVVFMDKRFLWKNYRAVFPVDMKFHVTKEPEVFISNFLNSPA